MDGFHSLYKQNSTLPDAIICANDNIAVGALTAAEQYGFHAPEDFIITGFDDFDKARYFEPRISTISHIRENVGIVCADIFHKIWNGETLSRFHYTPSTPIFWDSCGCHNSLSDKMNEREYLKGQILYNIETSTFEESVLALEFFQPLKAMKVLWIFYFYQFISENTALVTLSSVMQFT